MSNKLSEMTEAQLREQIVQMTAELVRLKDFVRATIPVLDECAEDERTFWGKEDKHGIAAASEQLLITAKASLEPADSNAMPALLAELEAPREKAEAPSDGPLPYPPGLE